MAPDCGHRVRKALPRNRGTAHRRAGRHRADRRQDRHRPSGRIRPRTDGGDGRPRRAHPRARRNARPERELLASTRHGTLREDAHRPETETYQNQTVQHRRRVPCLARRPPSGGEHDTGVPGTQKVALDLHRGTAATRESRYGTGAHLLQSGRYGHRPALLNEPQPAEHPDTHRTGAPDTAGIRPVGQRPPAALGRLLSGGATPHGASERRRSADRGLPPW